MGKDSSEAFHFTIWKKKRMKVNMNFRYGKQRKLRYIFNAEAEFFKIWQTPQEPCIHIIQVYLAIAKSLHAL
ncbi:hypothetical protein RDI58_015815 [Solanum bulbocastanum]|uniref:Uncharacterized protein n=1 Tax=Solanum bulbocastanum TaxID=147425 RepID=A0AAN8THP5_SOLBU